MIFDFRPSVSIDPEEAQLNEGGANAWDNCGAANYAWVLKQLGFGDPFEPQQVMDLIEGKGWRGGEVSWKLIDFFTKRIPGCPSITVEQGGDIVVRARLAAAQEFLTTNWWWSNSNGDIQPRNTGILHWSSVIYDTGSALGVRNTMRGQVVELPYADARAAYAGEFTTFHQSVKEVAVHPSAKRALVRLTYLAVLRREPESMQALQDWADKMTNDGSNADDIVALIAESEEGKARQAELKALLARPATALPTAFDATITPKHT